MLYALKGCILEGGGGTATNCYLKGVGVGTCIPHAVYSGRYLELYYFWRLREISNIYSGILCREVLRYAVSLFWRVPALLEVPQYLKGSGQKKVRMELL